MDAIPSMKVENNRVYIQCTSNNSVLQEVQKFKDLNLFCDVILEAKCDKTEREIRKEKLLVWSRRVRVSEDQKDDVEKWEQLPVHSCIIAAGSKMLKNKMLNLKTPDASYTIRNINMKYLKICIDFLYCLPISFSTGEIANVLSAAKFLGIDDLQPWCKAADESNRKVQSVKSLNISIGAVNVKTEESVNQQNISIGALNVKTEESVNQQNISIEAVNVKTEESVNQQNILIEAVNVKTEESDNQQQQHIEPVAKLPCVNIIGEISFGNSFRSQSKTSLPHNDISALEYVGLKLISSNNKSDDDKIGDSNNANDTDDYDALWELEKMDNLNTVKWNVPFDDDESDIELDYYIGNPRFTLENTRNLEPLKLYNCFYCEKNYALPDHFCDKSGKNMRLRRKNLCHICGLLVSTGSFTIHIRMHLQIKYFKCDVCDYAAITNVRLREHQQKHSTNKTFKCDLCDKSYRSRGAFRDHKVIAHNKVSDYQNKQHRELPYQCPECDFQCGAHSIAVRHARTKHHDCKTEEMKHFIKIHRKQRKQSQASGKATNPNNSNSEEFEYFPDVQDQDNETILIQSERGNDRSEKVQQYDTIQSEEKHSSLVSNLERNNPKCTDLERNNSKCTDLERNCPNRKSKKQIINVQMEKTSSNTVGETKLISYDNKDLEHIMNLYENEHSYSIRNVKSKNANLYSSQEQVTSVHTEKQSPPMNTGVKTRQSNYKIVEKPGLLNIDRSKHLLEPTGDSQGEESNVKRKKLNFDLAESSK